jgi:hypothetical protein
LPSGSFAQTSNEGLDLGLAELRDLLRELGRDSLAGYRGEFTPQGTQEPTRRDNDQLEEPIPLSGLLQEFRDVIHECLPGVLDRGLLLLHCVTTVTEAVERSPGTIRFHVPIAVSPLGIENISNQRPGVSFFLEDASSILIRNENPCSHHFSSPFNTSRFNALLFRRIALQNHRRPQAILMTRFSGR